ncbi:hypothetical protein [Mammaliicoccus sciuri]|uniref:hypothetical protein n=1 Tax=Mammaliicoccus sciuri TaxID=1296 RepID=UPI001FB1F76C|nr:hypothetical protein [Mammaliicoccus sciuri]MCJ1765839.1 hypothetical protein [Mammaliicoccus sciuri]MCJ1774679.1 hypothetical protein [Mammaliicoccus sciuri]
MTLPIIALVSSVLCLISSVIVYKLNKSRLPYDIASERYVNKSVELLEEKVQPLIDKYKEEQEQEESETRKAHWKSFNKWKMQKGMMNPDAGDRQICGACYNDSLELDVDYKESVEKSMYAYDGYHIKEDYPLSAEQKCTACGHIVDKWEYEERKQNGKD